MKNTARVIITKKCNRTCHYCCNEKDGTFDDSINLNSIAGLAGYSSVVISGGEPMLYWERVIAFAKAIREAYPHTMIYLQSATCTKYTDEVLQHVDGITYTVHEEASLRDAAMFASMQDLAMRYASEKNFRLNVHDDCPQYLSICPKAWGEVRFFHHRDECPVPANETLFTMNFEV